MRGKTRALSRLILATIGAVICVSVAGWLLYNSAKQVSDSRDALERSQSVLYDLQQQSQRLDRIESNLQLYLLTRDEADLRSSHSAVVAFYSGALHLEQQVADNAAQLPHAQNLEKQASLLLKSVDSFTQSSPLPSQELFACRDVVGIMQAAEHELLSRRTDATRFTGSRILLISLGFTGLSMIVILVLFGLLLRDALHRRRYEERLFEANEKLGGTIRALERQARESDLLTAARDELQLCMNSSQAQHSAARYLAQLLPGTSGGICLINESRQLIEVDATWNNTTALQDGFAPDACCGLRSGRMRWRRPGQSEVHCEHFAGKPPENYLCLPLVAHGETLGMVYVECGSAGIAAMVDANLRALQQMVELASIRIAGLNLSTILEHQSIRDGLTNLFNRRFMEIALDRELRRARRHHKPLAVLMLDIDHFKQLNDTYGHEAGDLVLREVAAVMREAVRAEDTICRYGGEEFVAILPELAINDALARAESIRNRVSELRLYHRGEPLREITISIGIAVYPQNGESLDELLSLADRALYEAKHLGRNRVVLAENVGSAPADRSQMIAY